jgi:hypothetical protein
MRRTLICTFAKPSQAFLRINLPTPSRWVLDATRECVLEPLRVARREAQESFLAAVTSMSDAEVDLRFKTVLFEALVGGLVVDLALYEY